jgi:hypothetical protein
MRYSSITVFPTPFWGASIKEGQSRVKRYRNRDGLKKPLVGQMLADVAVWLIRSRRALGWYDDGNKSLWSASELREKYERILCAPGDLIELRLKPTIPSDDSAARWLTRFGRPKPAAAALPPLSPFNGHVCKIRFQSQLYEKHMIYDIPGFHLRRIKAAFGHNVRQTRSL